MSSTVDSAVGEAPARVDAVQLLAEKRAALDAARERYKIAKLMRDEDGMATESRRREELTILISELEREAAAEVEVTARKAAEERLLGIKRAAGSVRSELEEDNKRIRELETALREANAKRTSRARKYETLQAEANAVVDRFELPALKLEVLAEPPTIQVPASWRHHMVRPSFEETKDGTRRTRRDYTEVGGTPGYGIIQTAGPKPFRALTEEEKQVLEDRAEERPNPVYARAAIEANALGNLGVPGGGVHRG